MICSLRLVYQSFLLTMDVGYNLIAPFRVRAHYDLSGALCCLPRLKTPCIDSLTNASEVAFNWLGLLALYFIVAQVGAYVLRLSRPSEQTQLLGRLSIISVLCLGAAAVSNTFVELPSRRLVRSVHLDTLQKLTSDRLIFLTLHLLRLTFYFSLCLCSW